MTHEQMDTLLDGLVRGELNPQQQKEAQAHLENCPVCQAKFTVLNDSIQLFDDEELPPAFQQNWRQAVQAEAQKEARQGGVLLSPRFTRLVALAATLLVLVGGTWAAGNSRRQAAQSMAMRSQADQMVLPQAALQMAEQPEADSMMSMDAAQEPAAMAKSAPEADIPLAAPAPQEEQIQGEAVQPASLEPTKPETATKEQVEAEKQGAESYDLKAQQPEGLALVLSDLLTFLRVAWPYFAGLAALALIVRLLNKRRKQP